MNGIIILARLDSARFPNKAITHVGGKRLIQHCIDEVKKLEHVEVILATSSRDIDHPLIEIAEKNNIKWYKGDLNNVAKRVYDCITGLKIDNFARVNGDSPLLKSHLLNKGFQLMGVGSYDIVTNLLPRRYPYGISVEIVNGSTFRRLYSEIANSSYFAEHITSIFYEQQERFKICPIPYANNLDHSKIHLTVDTLEDKLMMDKLFSLDPLIRDKSIEEIVRLYQEINKN